MKRTALIIACLIWIGVKCLFPPTPQLRRRAASFFGCQEEWIQALARGGKPGEKRPVSYGP